MAGSANANASLVIDRNVEAGRGERAAYITREETLTYEQLLVRVNRMGHLLRELGVRREERVLLVLDDTTVFPVAFLAALRIGAVPVPVSVRERAENFRYFIEDSYASVAVCDAGILASLQAATAGLELRYIARGGGDGAVELDGALSSHDHELAPVATHADDMAFWLYTSGSTGKPKGVVHLHKTIGVTCEAFGREVLEMSEDDCIFSTTKLYHAYGLGNSFSYPLYFGASAVLLEGPPTPERLLSTLRAHRPSLFCSVPALYKQLAADVDAGDAFDSVRRCISAAEPLPTRTFERWRERFDLEILDGIGATEMIVSFCSNKAGDVAPGTTGRPIPGYELRLLDETAGEVKGAGVGALEVKGDSRAACYWHQQARSRRVMRGEWLATGDRFERREDGRYVYVGRTDDMLKVGGLWVSPIDMEQVLLEHPAVAGVGVVGAKIDDYTRLVAFVECAAQASPGDQLSESLRALCKQRLRDHEYPHLIRFVGEIPRTLNGKPQRFKLRERIERELSAAPVPPSEERPRHAVFTGGEAQELAPLSEADREQAVLELVLSEISTLLGGESATAIDAGRTFEQLGFDSLMAVELSSRLANASGLRLPSTLIFDHPTPDAVARAVLAEMDGLEPPPPDGAAALALAETLEEVTRRAPRARMPPVPVGVRLKTSAVLRAVLPARVAVGRAERQGQAIWEHSASEREDALAAVETIVSGTPRAGELEELARLHLIERIADRALFWERPWRVHMDDASARRVREALASERGVLLSACHLGPYYRFDRARVFRGHPTYLVPGPWFFEPVTPDYWGRRLARWRNGTVSRLVRSTGSFRVIQALLERGDPVFLFFDLPGPRQTRFLGKPAMLAEGTAQLSVRADALVLPLRARRVGHQAWVDVGTPLDPRRFAGVDELHEALSAVHEAWILENPAAMEDPRNTGWQDGATPQAWMGTSALPSRRRREHSDGSRQKSGVAGSPT
jgi:benzoate-CoA ligase family protein